MEDPTSVVAERIVRELVGMPSSNHATITVNAGGAAVWIAATCCLVMLVVFLIMLALFVDHSRKIDDLHDYLNVIYQVAPHLRPEEKP